MENRTKYAGSTSEKLSYTKFWRNFYRKTSDIKTPFKASFELTYNCNLSCRHCYITADRNKKELSFKEICSILDQLARQSCFQISFTGGEALMRCDIFEILGYAKKKGFYIILLTNATLITSRAAARLAKTGVNEVHISVYGMTEKTQRAITGRDDSLQKCFRGIRLLKKNGIPIRLKALVTNVVIYEIKALREFAKKLNVPFENDYLIRPRLDGSKEPLSLRLSPRETIKFLTENYPSLGKEEKKETLSKEKRAFHKNFHKRLFYCGAGRNSLAITPYGEMNVCLLCPFPKYDLRKGTVADGWKELIEYIKSAKPSKDYKCDKCNLRSYCTRCPADGFLECGDKNACVPHIREIAFLLRKRRLSSKQGVKKCRKQQKKSE